MIFLVYPGAHEIAFPPFSWDARLNFIFLGGEGKYPFLYFPHFISVNSIESWKIGIRLEICWQSNSKSVSGRKGLDLPMQNACKNEIALDAYEYVLFLNKTE